MPLNDTAVIPAVQPAPKAPKVESEVAGEKSKDRKYRKSSERKDSRATTADEAIVGSGSATEDEITIQTFEHVCENLKTYVEGMDTRWVTESEIKQTRFCVEAMRTATERVKKLGKHSLDQHHMAAGVSSSFFTPSAIDANNPCTAPRPSPSNREPCGQRLPCMTNPNKRELEKTPPIPILEATNLRDVNPGDFAVRNENIIPESNQSKQSGQEWKCAVSKPADYDRQEIMPYSEAAKAAVVNI